VPFAKDFYEAHATVEARSMEEVEAFRKEHAMLLSGQGIPKPVRTFEEACFPPYLLEELSQAGFVTPTPIQCQGWPMAMSGRDVIGISATGSGKTLAFVLPAIVHINAQPMLERGDGPIVLILSPTRELAVQTMKECGKFGHTSKIKYSCCYGGTPKGP
jgi:ATP-dependent RNA helicase DDX5/DBP2